MDGSSVVPKGWTRNFTGETLEKSGVLGLVEDEPVAIEVARQELIGRAPQIKPEFAELEISDCLLYTSDAADE